MPLVAPKEPDCPCAVDMDPCGCGASLKTEFRTRGGVAKLCGLPEYITPSLPPKKYRRETFSGQINRDLYYDPNYASSLNHCSYYDRSETIKATGALIFSKSDCKSTDTRSDFSAGGWSCENLVQTRTRFSFVNKGGCCSPYFVGPAWGSQGSGAIVRTLSEEDTEYDAMARVKTSWSSWKLWSAGTDCCSFIERRGAGQFDFSFQKAELRITVKGAANFVVKVEVMLAQTPQGGGTTLIGRELYEVYCDGAGDASEVIEVPSHSGFTTCIVGVATAK